MPNGFGRGWYGRGYWRTAPTGYRYIGPCRCGCGPHAYYEEIATGRVVPPFEVFELTPEDELEALKRTKEYMERDLEAIKRRIERLEKKE